MNEKMAPRTSTLPPRLASKKIINMQLNTRVEWGQSTIVILLLILIEARSLSMPGRIGANYSPAGSTSVRRCKSNSIKFAYASHAIGRSNLLCISAKPCGANDKLFQRRNFITNNVKASSAFAIILKCNPLLAHAISTDDNQPKSTASASSAISKAKIVNPRLTSPKQIAQFIKSFCNSNFVLSVTQSGCNFIYRGLSSEEGNLMAESPTANNDIAAIIIKDEPFDLLDSETYQSDEAASYFQTLDDEMTRSGMNIKPGNGHLATTCPKEAAQWGKAVSIWPLGENGVEFAWLERGGVFWPRPNAKKEMNILTFPTKYESASSSIMVKDGMLENALQGDAWEIMFRADNGFLAVSSNIDSDLRRYLVEL